MSTFMLFRPNSLFGSSCRSSRGEDDFIGSSPLSRAARPASVEASPHVGAAAATRKEAVQFALKVLAGALVSVGLIFCDPSLAAESVLPSKPQPQSEPNQAVQPEVDKQVADAAAEKRKKLLADAAEAIAQTQNALKALEDKKNEEALKSLADVTGKLEIIVARDPKLALAPADTTVVSYDFFAGLETVKMALAEAKRKLADGEVQGARLLIDALASEIQIRTANIPLATYPAAIKAVIPLIDAGKVDEAKAQLQAALGTLVITTDVVPLPKLRAESLLKDAQTLTEKKDRSKEESDKLASELKAAREQLEIAEVLGYGRKGDYKPMYEQIESIEKASSGGKSGFGWFDKIKKHLSEVF